MHQGARRSVTLRIMASQQQQQKFRSTVVARVGAHKLSRSPRRPAPPAALRKQKSNAAMHSTRAFVDIEQQSLESQIASALNENRARAPAWPSRNAPASQHIQPVP